MNNKTEMATLANGCFWCSEAIFKRLKGVKSVLPGYAGGLVKNPSYDQVCTGKTGHAEAIQIEFDPKVITFEKVLYIFWHTLLIDKVTILAHSTDLQFFFMTKNKKSLLRNRRKSLKKKVFTEIPL
jgi:peptide-methionine (S)-S-oxide reductase